MVNKNISARTPVECKLCKGSKPVVLSRAGYLKLHIMRRHKDFLELRTSIFHLTVLDALKETYLDHVLKDRDIPVALLNKFNKDKGQPTATSSGTNKNTVTLLNKFNKDKGQPTATSNGTNKNMYQQLILDKCTACKLIKSNYDLTKDMFNSALKVHCQNAIKEDCRCVNKESCCCTKLQHSLINTDINVSKVEEMPAVETIESNFFFDEQSKRYFCVLCQQYTSKNPLPSRTSMDWVSSGFYKVESYKLKDAMKYHLKSKQHHMSKQREIFLNKPTYSNKVTAGLKEKCTENLCMAGQFFASKNLSNALYPDLCLLINNITQNIVSDNLYIHPLGNRHQSKMAIPMAKLACYHAVCETLHEKFKKPFMVTNSLPRLMLAADKGTAEKDGTRQVLVGTYIGEKGLPKETMITAAVIKDQTATGAATHIQKEVSKFLDPKQIAVISTDGASIYVGSEHGVLKQLKSNRKFSSKIIYLPDFCHKCERLIENNEADWVQAAIANSSWVVNAINQHNKLASTLQEYENQRISDNVWFHAPQGKSETRYAEYGHLHMHSVLKNVKILIECLPSIINSDEYDKPVLFAANSILKFISSPLFIAKIVLIHSVFSDVAVAEKAAQSSSFGPFEYINVVKTLKGNLEQRLKQKFLMLDELLATGVFKYEYYHKGKLVKVNVNLREMNEKLYPSRHENADVHSLKSSYYQWVTDILNKYDQYLSLPEPIVLAKCIFKDKEASFDQKVESFRRLFSLINAEFGMCSDECQGINKCSCLDIELKAFFKHVERVFSTPNKNLKHVFAYYLAESNITVVRSLGIGNVLRVIEVIQLMKASQSSTECIMSVVANIVKTKYKNIHRFGKESKYDMVNISAFLSFNSDIKSMDISLARKKFIEAGHQEAMFKTLPVTSKSKTLKRLLTGSVSSNKKRRKLKPIRNLETSRQVSSEVQQLSEEIVDDPLEASENNWQFTTAVAGSAEEEIVHDPNKASESNCQLTTAAAHGTAEEATVIPSTGKRPKIVSKSFNSETTTVYCSCKEEVQCNKWVACEKGNNCKSYLQRKETIGADGGDWFHLACVGLKFKPSKKSKWYCSLCKIPSTAILPKTDESVSATAILPKTNESVSATAILPKTNESVSATAILPKTNESVSATAILPKTNKSVSATAILPKTNESVSAKQLLARCLLQDNWKLVKINPDGNCMFSAFAIHMFGQPYHALARQIIMDRLHAIFTSEKYEGKWTYETCPSGNSLDDEAKFVRKVVIAYKQIILGKSYDASDELTLEKRLAYIASKKDPASYRASHTNVLVKYGTALEMEVFSLINKMNLWVLQPCTQGDGGVSYKWHISVIYNCPVDSDALSDLIHQQYVCFLYENEGQTTDSAHYTAIVPKDPKKKSNFPNYKEYKF